MNIKDMRELGYNRGWNVASWQDMPNIGDAIPLHLDWIGIGTIDSVEDQIEAWEMFCFDAESNDRDFSPFEFTAHDINESNDPERYWEAFDNGITDGIRAYRRKHHKLADMRRDAKLAA